MWRTIRHRIVGTKFAWHGVWRQVLQTLQCDQSRVELQAGVSEDTMDAKIVKATYVGSHMEYTVRETGFRNLFAVSAI